LGYGALGKEPFGSAESKGGKKTGRVVIRKKRKRTVEQKKGPRAKSGPRVPGGPGTPRFALTPGPDETSSRSKKKGSIPQQIPHDKKEQGFV